MFRYMCLCCILACFQDKESEKTDEGTSRTLQKFPEVPQRRNMLKNRSVQDSSIQPPQILFKSEDSTSQNII